jgi:hypothetical protein
MWYALLMPELPDHQLLSDANSAVGYAQEVRRTHARRSARGSYQREHDISVALARLKSAMRPIRRRIAKIAYTTPTDAVMQRREVFIEASQALQAERRKLWKMKKKRRSST